MDVFEIGKRKTSGRKYQTTRTLTTYKKARKLAKSDHLLALGDYNVQTSVRLLPHSVHFFRKGEHYVAFTNHLVTKGGYIAKNGGRFLVQSDWIVL